ncbi:MAG: peptide chain release factor 1 [Armatimonadetes bacterium]|nr:peptide chain release factor 1 [Armatimonadota bacterium]
MFEKLAEVEQLYQELERRMADPALLNDMDEYRRVHKQYSDLTEIVAKYREYQNAARQLDETEQMLRGPLDDDLRDLAQSELDDLKERRAALEQQLKVLLLPKDPNDEKDVILEVRAAAGGEEAALFAGELLRMYMRYAEKRGWNYEFLSSNETGIGGYKEAVLEIHGQGAYSAFKFESGVHRVQRVPVTEASGRMQTSTATVIVMPEAEDVEIEINPNDLIREHTLSQGAGGQNVQKNETAVRLIHKPTGMVVTCQDQRSQLQNYEKALRVLKARLYDIEMQKQQEAIGTSRKGMVGSGDRSEKIRTYHFPQDRMTDHRIGLTVHNLPAILDGDIQHVIDTLVSADQAEKLKQETEE